MSRVIGVFSGKGGVGKTTLVANLGVALANVFHKNVVVFDSNLHSSHLGLHFGLYEDMSITLKEVLKDRRSILQAVYIHPTTGVRIIPAPLDGEGLDLTAEKCRQLVSQVKSNYDIVILDCAPGLGREVLTPMQAVDEAIVISTPDIAAVTDAMKTIEMLRGFKKNVLGLVINRYSNKRYELTPQEITSTTNYNIIRTIPEDSKIPDSIAKGIPVVISYPGSKASRAFKELAAFLINESYEVSLFEKFKSMLPFNKHIRYPKHEVEPTPDHTIMRTEVPKKEIPRKEVSDLTDINSELLADIKEELKREIMKKVKQRLKEKMV